LLSFLFECFYINLFFHFFFFRKHVVAEVEEAVDLGVEVAADLGVEEVDDEVEEVDNEVEEVDNFGYFQFDEEVDEAESLRRWEYYALQDVLDNALDGDERMMTHASLEAHASYFQRKLSNDNDNDNVGEVEQDDEDIELNSGDDLSDDSSSDDDDDVAYDNVADFASEDED
jgi:hypothetical protein